MKAGQVQYEALGWDVISRELAERIVEQMGCAPLPPVGPGEGVTTIGGRVCVRQVGLELSFGPGLRQEEGPDGPESRGLWDLWEVEECGETWFSDRMIGVTGETGAVELPPLGAFADTVWVTARGC